MAKQINGYTAFFVGWTALGASLSDGGPNANGYDSTGIVFTASNGLVVAKYAYYTVSVNRALPAGTWTFAGNLTVPSGVTLTVSPGATLIFPSPTAVLTVNGTLNANGATFSFTSNYPNLPYTSGIAMYGNGSTLTNCTISGADRPLALYNISSATISNCTINNSSFGSSQAVLISASTPTISNLTIAGLSNSSNGVRYTSGSGGTLQNCEIHHLGLGSGIVIEGGSSPTLNSNNLHDNYYNGIYAINNGSPTVHANGNTIRYNTTSGGNNYSNGLCSTNSHTDATNNIVRYVNWGYTSYNSGSITGGNYESACNTATDCNFGMYAYNGSGFRFGQYDTKPPGTWTQACNNLYNNNTYNAIATASSWAWAQGDYWGQSGQVIGVYYDGSSWIESLYALDDVGACWGSGGYMASQSVSTSAGPSGDLALARSSAVRRDITLAKTQYLKVIGNGTLSEKKSALAELYVLLRDMNDPEIDQTVENCATLVTELPGMINDLLMKAYVVKGRYKDAKTLGDAIVRQNPGKPEERDALIQLTSLAAFDTSYASVSMEAVKRLRTKFAYSVEPALFAAFGMPPNISAEFAESKRVNKKVENDSVGSIELFGISSYPNPFNPVTQIKYIVDHQGPVTVKVYDQLGREVAVLVDGVQNPGTYSVHWNGSSFASGIYYARLEASGRVAIQKLLLMK